MTTSKQSQRQAQKETKLETSEFLSARMTSSNLVWNVLVSILTFLLVTLASSVAGEWITRLKFPIITGYLLSGVLAGPFVLGVIDSHDLPRLKFINDFALTTIAFSAGSELYFPELKKLFKTIIYYMGAVSLLGVIL